MIYILSKPPENWKGYSGRVDEDFLRNHLPPPEPLNTFIMVCGPPPLNKSLGGEMDYETDTRSTGLLHVIGYSQENIHLF